MQRITDDMTALASQNLTIELVLQGECLEFDPEKKIDKKQKYTLLDPVTKIIDMYTKDLQQAYTVIGQLEDELADSKKALDEVTVAAKKSADQVRAVLAGQAKFGDAEARLSELMASVEELRESNNNNNQLIAKLRQQVKDAQDMAALMPELKEDVQFVLDTLEEALAKSGISIDDILEELEEEQ